jgi:hypothetical protein
VKHVVEVTKRNEQTVRFEILDQIDEIEVIAVGTIIRDLAYLQKIYGSGRVGGGSSRAKPMSDSRMETSGGLSYTGMKPTGLAAKTSRLNVIWNETMMSEHKRHFAICVDNSDYEASLILRKVYEIMPDELGAKDELLRIVDESGEDYLYHKSHFIVVEFPLEVEHALLAAQSLTP